MFGGPDHYEATVNKGSLNVGRFTGELNQRWKNGWKLGQVIEQHGNTLVVWERRDPEPASAPPPPPPMGHLPPPPPG